jgi:hypothetical protein
LSAQATRAPSAREVGVWLGALAASALGTLLLGVVAPFVPLPVTETAWGALASFALAFAWVSAEVLAVGALVPHLAPRHAWLPVVLAAPLVALGIAAPAPSLGATAIVAPLLLGAGTALGAVVGARIQHPGHLGVVAYVSSVADLTSVFHEAGPSARILESAPALAVLAVGAPMPGTADVSPILGVGDVILVGLYLAACRVHGLATSRTRVALGIGLGLTFVVLVVVARAIPALPLLGLAIVLAHPETRLPPTHERKQALAGVVVVTALAAWLWLGSR